MSRLKYPVGPVTPHGCYQIRAGNIPSVSLQSYNDQIVLWLMGGEALPDPMRPESVAIDREGGLTGLIAPWEIIAQQGATQDGHTFVDALYGPMEVTAKLIVRGRDAKRTRQVSRHLIESIDVKKRSEFGWRTPELGYWWAPIRWHKAPPDKYSGTPTEQAWTLQLLADSAFWQSYPDISEFEFLYEDFTETFRVNYSAQQDLGPNWPQRYTGNGVGFHYANGSHAIWSDDPDSVFFTGTKRVVCGPYDGFSAGEDEHEVASTFHSTPEFTVGSGAANDIWARMGRTEDGLWDGNGIRARIGWGFIQISRFNNFAETILAQSFLLVPPLAGDRFILKCGYGGNLRRFRLERDSIIDGLLIDVTESGTASMLGEGYRGVGFGLQGGAAVITQATPGALRSIEVDGEIIETFDTDYPEGAGPNWPLYYEGRNDAYMRTLSGEVIWIDNSGTETQEVVNGPFKDFGTATNNQVVSMVLGSFPEWSAPETGANDLWARMGRSEGGSWDGSGIRLRCTTSHIHLSAWVDFEQVWERRQRMGYELLPGVWIGLTPFPGDKWQLAAGFPDDPRMFKVYRNGSTLMQHKEVGTQSLVGSSNRGVGFGVRAGGALITQATPAIVRKVAAGDNAAVTQSGFLDRHNAGDQDAYDEYTVYGPATKVEIANGPGSTEMVEILDLKAGEIAHIRTDPRRGGIFDYTPRTGNDTAPALFGAKPSDTMYRKMKGRFTSKCAIPAKQPGMRVATHKVRVTITGGNADSRVMAQLTPLRRYPQ